MIVILLSVIMLSVITMSVIIMSFVMLSVNMSKAYAIHRLLKGLFAQKSLFNFTFYTF
jgi:hypothetical protein